jgi:hypothetical protein
MPERESRIVVKGGKVSLVDPKSGREVATGLKVVEGPQKDRLVRHLKDQLEGAGNRVTYREV